MTIRFVCSDYGFECGFVLEGTKSTSLIKKIQDHFETEHGIEYPIDAIIQMLVNKGYSKDSIKNA
jgi:predicted small metal-binding protein